MISLLFFLIKFLFSIKLFFGRNCFLKAARVLQKYFKGYLTRCKRPNGKLG